MRNLFLFSIFFAILSCSTSKAEIFKSEQYIESKLSILADRQKQLDPRGIYIGDLIDFLYPLSILSHDSIDYDPHAKRLSHSNYRFLERWISQNKQMVCSSLYLEAYYACLLHSGMSPLTNIPINEDLKIIPCEILEEDIDSRLRSKNKNNHEQDNSNLLEYLLIDSAETIDSAISDSIFKVITIDTKTATRWVEILSNYEESDRIMITRKIFVYYFYAYYKERPYGKFTHRKEIEDCWNVFLSSPLKKWLLKKQTDYYHLENNQMVPFGLNIEGQQYEYKHFYPQSSR